MHRPRFALYVRNAAFAVLALAYTAPFVLVSPAVLLPLRYVRPVVDAYLRGIAFLLKHVCGLSYEVRGLERLRGQPVLIAAVHQTSWESLYLPMLLGDPVMVIEDEIFRTPLVGSIARKRGYIPAQSSGGIDKVRQSFEMAQRQSRGGRNILTFPSGMPSGSQPAPPLRRDVAALYEALDVPCVPVALNSSRFWQFRSWLRHPGVITVEILAPIAPGLEKQAFMDTLETRLNGATERLMHEADPPALMAVPTPAAKRMAAAMRSAHSAQK
jgi:1-acyl-sn-glycerol-3-phosphate acyltransferase